MAIQALRGFFSYFWNSTAIDEVPPSHPGLPSLNHADRTQCPYLKALYHPKTVAPQTGLVAGLTRVVSSTFLYGWNTVFREPNLHVPSVRCDPNDNAFDTLSKLQALGPEIWLLQLSKGRLEPLLKTQAGTKWLYLARDPEAAKKILGLGSDTVGRGSLFGTFAAMIGPEVFFSMDGPGVGPKKKLFKDAVYRTEENFERLKSLTSSTLDQIKKNNGHHDGVGCVSRFVIDAIGRCFVGMHDIDLVPSDAFTTFMQAGVQIIHGGVDALSVMTSPTVRSEFRTVKADMERIWDTVIEHYLDQMATSNNYVRDLAVMRAAELNPKNDFSQSKKGYYQDDPNNACIRDLIKNDKTVREDGPTTLFASLNLTRSLFFMIEMLQQHDNIWEEVCREIKPLLEKQDEGQYTLNDISEKNAPYLTAFVNECLFQLTPIPAMGRELLTDATVEIQGLSSPMVFRKGDVVLLSFRDLQGNGSQPEFKHEFQPEAWLEGNSTRDLWTFGQQHRACPAKPFAIQTMKQFVVEMARKNIRLKMKADTQYTTQFGGNGPDYDPTKPVAMGIFL